MTQVTVSSQGAKNQASESSTYVDDRPLGRVLDGTPEYFVGKRGGVAFSQEDVTHHVHDRVDVSPMKVGVGDASGGLFEVDEKCGDGIGNSSARRTKNTVAAFVHPMDFQIFREV